MYFLAQFEGPVLVIYFDDEKGDGIQGKVEICPPYFPDQESDDGTAGSPDYRQRVKIEFGKLSAILTLSKDGVECWGERERTKKGKIRFNAEWATIRHL